MQELWVGYLQQCKSFGMGDAVQFARFCKNFPYKGGVVFVLDRKSVV